MSRLDDEFICGIVRNRSGIDSGELDYEIDIVRTERDLDNVIKEVEFLLEKLNELRLQK
jgi:molybdopterin synthase catalytic subunit